MNKLSHLQMKKHNKKTLKRLNKEIAQQEKFAQAQQFVLALLQAYRRSPDNLIFINTDVCKSVGIDDRLADSGYDQFSIAESFDELGQMYVDGSKYLGITGNGLFSVISFVPKKKKASIEALIALVQDSDMDMI